MKITTALCFAASVLLISAENAAAAPKKMIRIGVAEGKGSQRAAESFGPFLKHANSSPDFEFEMVVFADGDEQYDALKGGKVDLAFLGPATYAKAHHEFKAEPLVAEAGDLRSMIVVAKSSPLASVEQLKGKTLALGYDGSTTTHLLPMLLLSKHHLRKEDLGRALFIGDQTKKIVEAVLDGTADAGGISDTLYHAHENELRILDTSDALPGATIVANPKLGTSVTTALRALFASYVPVPGTQRFPKGAVAVTDATYNRVRFLCKVVLGRSYL
jgi:phosphonate transport system substrate-binding protein